MNPEYGSVEVKTHPDRTRQIVVPRIEKRGWIERVRRFVTGADMDEAEARPDLDSECLPAPLPRNVRSAAIGQLVANGVGVLSVIGTVVYEIVRNVLIPGLTGTGGDNIDIRIGLSFGAILPYFFARAALRVLRRDKRGISAMRIFATVTGVITLAGFLGLMALVIFGPREWSMPIARNMIAALTAGVFNIWTVRVLNRYERELDEETDSTGDED